MDILLWIQENRPGDIQDLGNRFEVAHKSGEHSTLWKRQSEKCPLPLSKLLDCYTVYDGMDLFSSTFKFASIISPKQIDGVDITFTLESLASEVVSTDCGFPLGAIPFMYQAGIGFYAVEPQLGTIYEWDTESGEISGEFDSIEEVLNEWLDAVT